MQRIAVTGATGFIGTRLLPQLVQADYDVRALTRRTQQAVDGIAWVKGALADQTSLNELVKGVDAVIHIAGSVRGRSQAEFLETNLYGLERLVRAIANAGTPIRLLSFSSITAAAPELSHYAFSKAQAEALLARQENLDWTIFRPTAVYGPGDTELLPLFQTMRRGLALVPAHEGLLSFVHVDDVVSATLSWLEQADLRGETFEIHDGHLEGYDWQQILSTMQPFAQRRIRRLILPRGLLAIVAGLNLGWSRISGQAPMLTPAKLNELFHRDWRCRDTRFSQLSGWTPRYDLSQGLAATFEELDR